MSIFESLIDNNRRLNTIVEGQRVQGSLLSILIHYIAPSSSPLLHMSFPLKSCLYNNKNIKFLILTMSGVLSSLVAVRTPDIVRMKIIISLYL